VPRIERHATLTWEGSAARGSGTMTAGSGAFAELPFSEPSRIAPADEAAGKTSPEELLAAAHGACFTMSLAGELARARTPPERLDTHVTVVMDEVDGAGHRVVSSHVSVQARVPGSDEESFARVVAAADAGCPFSALVRGTAQVSFEATLVGD
jgi:osmotically inducible protein OsmC